MHKRRIRNIVLAVVAGLMLFNLGFMIAPAAHAIPTTQYKAISLDFNMASNPRLVQEALNQQSAEGWVYVGDASGVLIFKK